MYRKQLIWILGFTLSLVFITGCSGAKAKTPIGQATSIPAPATDKATVTGSVFTTALNQPYPKAAVWLAEVFRQGGDGAYVLDHAFSPAVYADDKGVFVIANVDPKEYVIVIGDPEGLYEVIPDESGRARVWNTEAGKILDVGQLNVSLTPPPTPPQSP
jgi:hypothetical protein